MQTIRTRRRGAFTLVELLVVISILAVLIGILVPGLRGAKRVSKRVACGGNLRSVGQAMRMYLNDSNDYLPVVCMLPSLEIEEEEDHPKPGIATVLLPYVQKTINPTEDMEKELEAKGNEVFKCPADVAGKDKREGKNYGKSYFETENSSYAFNVMLQFLRDGASFFDDAISRPVKLSEVVNSERAKRMFGGNAAEEEIWLMRDYIAFHGKPGDPGASNYLYVDGRVSDLER